MRQLAIMAAFLAGLLHASAAVPRVVEHRGQIEVDNLPYEGVGSFKFALIEGATGATLWSNDGTSAEGAEPVWPVELSVHEGRYRVLLGDPALPQMSALPPGVFDHDDVRLRIWFGDGSVASQRLEPDEQIAAVAYAVMAGSVPDGAITMEKLADGAVRGAKLGPIDAASIATGTIGAERLPGLALAGKNLADLTSVLEARGNLQLAEPRRGLARTTRKLFTRQWPLTVALAGDSIMETKRYAIERALGSTFGLAGFGLGRLAGRVTAPASFFNEGFEVWPTGVYFRLEAGGTVTFAHDTVNPVMGDTLKVYYVREAGAGTFKLQTSLGTADFADETGSPSVSADGALEGAIMTVRKPAAAPLRLRLVGLSGAVKIIGAAIYRANFEGVVYCDFSKSGLDLNRTLATPPEIVRPIMQDAAPDLFVFEMKDNAAAMAAHLAQFRALIDPAGADWIMIGSSPFGLEESDRTQREANRWLRGYAEARGLTYWDGYSLFKDGPTALAQAFLDNDKVHLTELGKEYAVAAMFSELRLGSLRTDSLRESPVSIPSAASPAALSGRTVWADATQGNDSTALRQRVDRPFKTLRAAKNAAQPGDTIIVAPGRYDESGLLRDKVNWLFLPGAEIAHTGAGAMWDDSADGANSAVVCRIEGSGVFGTSGNAAAWPVFRITNPGSNIAVHATAISAAGIGIFGSAGSGRFDCEEISTAGEDPFVVENRGANLEVCDARVFGRTGKPLAAALGQAGTLRLRRCTLVNTGTRSGSTCLHAGGARAAILDHCTLVSGLSTSVAISAAVPSARIKSYQCVANRGLARGVTDLVGPLQVNPHVSE